MDKQKKKLNLKVKSLEKKTAPRRRRSKKKKAGSTLIGFG